MHADFPFLGVANGMRAGGSVQPVHDPCGWNPSDQSTKVGVQFSLPSKGAGKRGGKKRERDMGVPRLICDRSRPLYRFLHKVSQVLERNIAEPVLEEDKVV